MIFIQASKDCQAIYEAEAAEFSGRLNLVEREAQLSRTIARFQGFFALRACSVLGFPGF